MCVWVKNKRDIIRRVMWTPNVGTLISVNLFNVWRKYVYARASVMTNIAYDNTG